MNLLNRGILSADPLPNTYVASKNPRDRVQGDLHAAWCEVHYCCASAVRGRSRFIQHISHCSSCSRFLIVTLVVLSSYPRCFDLVTYSGYYVSTGWSARLKREATPSKTAQRGLDTRAVLVRKGFCTHNFTRMLGWRYRSLSLRCQHCVYSVHCADHELLKNLLSRSVQSVHLSKKEEHRDIPVPTCNYIRCRRNIPNDRHFRGLSLRAQTQESVCCRSCRIPCFQTIYKANQALWVHPTERTYGVHLQWPCTMSKST